MGRYYHLFTDKFLIYFVGVMSKRTIHKFFAVGLAVLSAPTAFAHTYDSYAIGKAAGGYLIVTDMLIRISKSQCGYLLRRPIPSMEVRRKEIIGLPPLL